jgi:hypothetical protein
MMPSARWPKIEHRAMGHIAVLVGDLIFAAMLM